MPQYFSFNPTQPITCAGKCDPTQPIDGPNSCPSLCGILRHVAVITQCTAHCRIRSDMNAASKLMLSLCVAWMQLILIHNRDEACWHEGAEMTDTDRRPSLTVDYMLVGALSWWLLFSNFRWRLPTANCQLSLLTHLRGAYSAASLAIGPIESCVSVDALSCIHATHKPSRPPCDTTD